MLLLLLLSISFTPETPCDRRQNECRTFMVTWSLNSRRLYVFRDTPRLLKTVGQPRESFSVKRGYFDRTKNVYTAFRRFSTNPIRISPDTCRRDKRVVSNFQRRTRRSEAACENTILRSRVKYTCVIPNG